MDGPPSRPGSDDPRSDRPAPDGPRSSWPTSGWRMQLAVGLLAMALWSVYPKATFAALLAAYALAWLGLNGLRAANPRWLRRAPPTGALIALGALLALAPMVRAAELATAFVENEGLDAVDHAVAARLRLERTPSIAPPLISSDRPQTFYVHAPGAASVDVRFGADGPRVDAERLGHGAFRLAYDPRRDGALEAADGPIEATIRVDGEPHARAMEAVTPLAHPRWLAVAPDRARAATVSEETDALFVVGRDGLERRVEVGDGPTDVAFLDARRVVVSHRYEDAAWVVDAANGEVLERIDVGPFQRRVAVGPGGVLAVARGGSRPAVIVRRPPSDLPAEVAPAAEREGRIELGGVPDWVAFGPDGDTLVVAVRRPAALHRFAWDGAAWSEDRPALSLGRPAVTMARAPNGRRVVIAVTDYRPEGPPHLGNHFVQDQLLRVDVEAWRVVDRTLTALRTSRQRSPGDLDRGVSPMGVHLTPDGDMLVAFAGTDDVARWTPDGAIPLRIALDAPLAAPFSAVELAGGALVVTSPVYGAIAVLDADGATRHLDRLAPGDRALLDEGERALQRRIGERTFYEGTRAGVSCQSCHLHAESDGGEHNIGGATFVATLDVRGLLGTPPYLRDGGYPLLGSLDELSQTLYRGYLRKQGGRRISLDRYLASLPRPTPPRQLEARDAARERRGLDVFVRARCVLCHAPPAFTNLGQHPAEALFPRFAAAHPDAQLDTPSLLGLAESAPYLVDGRAETLEAIFREHDPARRHGDTADLDDDAMADLLFFLEGL